MYLNLVCLYQIIMLSIHDKLKRTERKDRQEKRRIPYASSLGDRAFIVSSTTTDIFPFPLNPWLIVSEL